MQVQAQQLRIADVVRIPGLGEYEIRKVQQLPEGVEVCVGVGPDDTCTETYKFGPRMVLEVKRPAELFGGGTPANGKAAKGKPTLPAGMTRGDWARQLAQLAGAPDCPSDVYAIELGEMESNLLEDTFDQELRALPKEWWAEDAGELDMDEWLGKNGEYDEITAETLIEEKITPFHQKDAIARLKQDALMKRAYSRLFAKVLKALRNAKTLGDKVTKSKAGTKARDKWMAKLGVAEGHYDQAVEDMAVGLGHGTEPDTDPEDDDLDADAARTVYTTIRRCAEELALGKRLERQVRQRQIETMRTAPRERLPGGKAAGRRPEEFDKADLARGIEIELEHTPDRATAREIAMDHLAERPDYYVLLEKMEATPEPPDLARLQAERLSKPWTTDAARYQSALGVKQPWIAEISPVQMGRMSARAKKAYDAKRAAEWEASGVAKERWRKEVIRAFELSLFRLSDDEVTNEAREAVRFEQRRAEDLAQKRALVVARTANQVLPDEVAKGHRVWDLMRRQYGVVTKVFTKSARVEFLDGKDRTIPIGQLQWLSYDDLKGAVERGDPIKPESARRDEGSSAVQAAEDRLRAAQTRMVATERAWMLSHPTKLREAKNDFAITHRSLGEELRRAEAAYQRALGTYGGEVPWLATDRSPTVEEMQAVLTARKVAEPSWTEPSPRAVAAEQREGDERRARLHKAQQYPATAVKTTSDAVSVLTDAFTERGWTVVRSARYTYVTDPTDSFRLQIKERSIRSQHRPGPRMGYIDGRDSVPLIAGARGWMKLADSAERVAASHARKLKAKIAAVPEAAPLAEAHARAEAAGKLLLRVNPEEGILLCGDTKPVKDAIKTVRPHFRYSRNLPKGCAWYVARSRGKTHSHTEVQAIADAIAKATGRGVDVDHAGTPHTAKPPETAGAFIPPVFRGKTGSLTEAELDVLDQLESAIVDNPRLPQDKQTRQYFESDGKPYDAAYTLTSRGMAAIVDQNLKGATHWVLIRATDKGLRHQESRRGSTFEVGDSVVTTTLEPAGKPTHAEVAAAAKAEYEQITETAMHGPGLTPYLQKKALSAREQWIAAEAKAKRAKARPARQAPAPAPKEKPVMVWNMANYMKGLPDRPTLGQLHEVLRKVGRDLGPAGVKKMRAYLRKQAKFKGQADSISYYAYQTIGELAMAKGTFPPVPERGDTYSKPEWQGYVSAIAGDPEVKAVIDESEAWSAKMTAVLRKTGADAEVGTPASHGPIWDHHDYERKVRTHRYALSDNWRITGKPKTVKLLQEHVAYARESFGQLAVDMRILLDPKIWDKRTDPDEVYPLLCKIDTDFAKSVLERLHGVPFNWGRDGRDQVSDLCEGKTSVKAVRGTRAREELESAQRDLADVKRHKALAAKLLPIFTDASKGGTRLYTKVLLNNALKRAGYKLARHYDTGRGFTESSGTVGGVRKIYARLSLKVADEHYGWSAEIDAKGGSEDKGFKALEAEVRASAADGVAEAAATVERREDVLAEILGKPRKARTPEPKHEKVEPMAENGPKHPDAEALSVAYEAFKKGKHVAYRGTDDFRTGWESVGMFCQQRTQGGMSITICPSLLPKGHKDCPPIPDAMFKSQKSKIVLCQPGRSPTYFAHPNKGGLEQAKLEANRRFAGAGKKAELTPGKAVTAPVQQFKAQDEMLSQLVPTRTVLVAGHPRYVAVDEPVDAKGVKVGYPDVGPGPYTAMVELRKQPDSGVGAEAVSTKEFVAGLQARKYQIVPEVILWEALQTLAARANYKAPADGYHTVRVGNDRMYYVELASGEIPDPVDDSGGYIHDRKQIAAFRAKVKRTVVVEPPKGQSLRDGVLVLLPNKLAHYYNAATGKGWGSTDNGKTWGTTNDPKDYPTEVRKTILGRLAQFDDPAEVHGAWRGLVFPTDYPKGRVGFEPPTGGTFDLDALYADVVAAKQADIAQDTVTSRGAVAAAQRRLNWAKKEMKATKRRPAKAKPAPKAKPAAKAPVSGQSNFQSIARDLGLIPMDSWMVLDDHIYKIYGRRHGSGSGGAKSAGKFVSFDDVFLKKVADELEAKIFAEKDYGRRIGTDPKRLPWSSSIGAIKAELAAMKEPPPPPLGKVEQAEIVRRRPGEPEKYKGRLRLTVVGPDTRSAKAEIVRFAKAEGLILAYKPHTKSLAMGGVEAESVAHPKPRKAAKPKRVGAEEFRRELAAKPRGPKIKPIATPTIKPRETIPRRKLWDAVLDYNQGGVIRTETDMETYRVAATPAEMATKIRKAVKDWGTTFLAWEGPGKGYTFSMAGGGDYFKFDGPDPVAVVKAYNAGAPAPGRAAADMAAYGAKETAARRKARDDAEAHRQKMVARAAPTAVAPRAKPTPVQKPVQKRGHIPVALSWREGEAMVLCKVPTPTPQVLRVVLAQLGFSTPNKQSGGCWHVRRSSERHYSERHLAALAGRLEASGFDVTATYQGKPVQAEAPREAPPKAALAAVAPPVPSATKTEQERGIKPRHLQVVPAAPPARAKPARKPAKPSRAAKPKAARRPAKPKAAPKGRKGRYAVLEGSPGRKGATISTHRTKPAAVKAAKTWVAKDQLERIVKGNGSRGQSSAVVYHDGTNLEAAVRLLVPTVHRRSIVKSAKIGNDSYDEITIGLVKLCNVDLERRITAGKAKTHKAPGKAASKRPAPRKQKPKLSAREQSRILDRIIAGKDKI